MTARWLLLLGAGVVACAQVHNVGELRRQFFDPPDDARIMMRWWWFGSAVTKPELERELRAMKAAGIGGVEVQPVYPLELNGNLPYLSDGFIDSLRFAAAKARELGVRVDITLGSGWPYGGPHISVDKAAGRLRCDRVPVPAHAKSIALPNVEDGEKLIAAFLMRGDTSERISTVQAGRFLIPEDLAAPHTVLFFIASRTGQQVKRPALGAEGFVLDHYDRSAIEHHLKVVGDRLLQAFGPNPPHAVFSDSLEVYGSDWTPDLLEEFRKRRGYDLTPFLPALVGDFGARTAEVRRDWGRTLTELAEERYLTPIREWAKAHGTRFRSQTYGIPPVMLSSNALVDLPEGEGSSWREFTSTRWASSASHLYQRPVTSSETWTWLHSPAFRATPLDMKAEADLHFLQGVNQLIGHGWPYSPPSAGEPGWRFYAAAVFNDHNPWWIVMPDIAKYLQRVSFLLRQGEPANDIAVYLPTEDAWSDFTAGKVSINQAMPALLGPELIPAILDAGFNFDFTDDRAIQQVGITHPVLVLPRVKRIPQETARKIAAFKQSGGVVVEAARLGELARIYAPDFATGDSSIGFIHRKLSDADIYFVANTSNHAVHATAHVRTNYPNGEWWDPCSDRVLPAGRASAIALDLAPYESRVLVFSASAAVQLKKMSEATSLDFSFDWKVAFPAFQRTINMHELRSWTADEPTRFFSGQAVYEKAIDVPAEFLKPDSVVTIDFGEGAPVQPQRARTNGMRAWIEAPVREAAVVMVNGQRAGSVWRPPYEVDITKLLHAGSNTIRIEVANLAINNLSGQSLPTYKLLNLRYGERFQPQDMQNLQPLPSGLLGPVKLVSR
jgi:glycosyl hydrolase family 106( putative alpha-L-rhamnosidase)